MTDISLCVASYRPGFNMLIESLKHLEFDGSWECVFADEIYDQRRKAVEEHKGDLPLKHVRAEPYEYSCPASTMNESVRQASGELILIVGDHSIYAPDYLQKHWDAYKDLKDATLVSSYIDLEPPEIKENPKIDDYSIFKEEFDIKKFLERPVVHAEERHNFIHNWLNTYQGFLTGEFTQGLIGIPRELMVRINGFDELYNAGKGYSDGDLVHRASLLGWRFILSTDLRVYRCAHPHKKIEDLKYPFTEKKTYRTREENKRRLMDKMQRVSRKLTLVNSHKGLRDLEWLNDKQILVQGGGAEVCTRKWVSILQHQGLPILHNESFSKFTFTDVSDVVVYGVSPFDFDWTEPYRDRIKIWFWWVGTDAYNAINGTFGIEIPEHENYRHLAISERVQLELKTIGIESEVIMDYEDPMYLDELDKDNYREEACPFTVLIYMPSDRLDFYHYDLMKEVVEEFQDNDSIRFIFFGNKEPLDIPTGLNPKATRCYQLGYVTGDDKKELYKEVYVYLRSVEHDGQPEIIIEMKKMGRHVICNYPYPHTIEAHSKEGIVNIINELYEKFRNEGRPLDEEGMKYYREKFTKNNFINRFIELFYGEDCLKKWMGEE